MISNLFRGGTIDVLAQVVTFTQKRHGVLAGNIANLDTPGYRSRDLSVEQFEANLREAIEARDSPRRLPRRSLGEPTRAAPIRDFSAVGAAADGLLYHDESDVSLEETITEVSKNHGRHNLAISLMTAQFRLLESAISERVA